MTYSILRFSSVFTLSFFARLFLLDVEKTTLLARRRIRRLISSELARSLEPDATDAEVEEVVAGNTAFALDLYTQVAQGDEGNVMVSPYSVSIAAAMLYAGARTSTEEELAQTFHYTLGQENLHPALNKLDLELESRSEASENEDRPFQLSIVNALWGAEGYTFLPSYLDVLALHYGAGVHRLDFARDPDGSRETINTWVEDETQSKIEDLLPQGSITSDVVMVLTNAIYFNAAWADVFTQGATAPGTFELADGSSLSVPMMRRQAMTPAHLSADGTTVVELAYDGGEMSMVVLMPALEDLDVFDAALDAEKLDGYLSSVTPSLVDLTFPSFEFEDATKLSDSLKALGMTESFGGSADFSGINGEGGIFVDEVYHKTFISVDEEGTEAAAATAIVVRETSAPIDEPVSIVIDKPFLFLIRDRTTGSILFMGRVVDPS